MPTLWPDEASITLVYAAISHARPGGVWRRPAAVEAPGQVAASSNEVTLSYSCCWEHTKIGFNSGFGITIICTGAALGASGYWHTAASF